jgi:HlyD family secretion protein
VVSQLRMNPTTVQNVVTYDAIIDFDNPTLKLFPGMTAYVSIPVADAKDVLKIPNGALRFKPQKSLEELQALYAKYGISAEGSGAAQGQSSSRGVIWKLSGSRLEPVEVSLGITDHAYTALLSVLKGELQAGDEVVTGAAAAKSGTPGVPIRR